jgi:predicted helicase
MQTRNDASEIWVSLCSVDWQMIRNSIIAEAPVRLKPSAPLGRFVWQQTVIDKGFEHFRHNARGRVQLPCGTGKRLLAYFMADAPMR